MTALLREAGLWGLLTAEKFVPDDYLWASVQQRWALLQGLLDTDGWARTPSGAGFGNTSEKLVDGVRFLVQSLGGTAKRYVQQPGFWVLNISLPQTDAPFRLARKVQAYQAPKRHTRRCIEKVERVEEAEAVCIKVDRDDGLFLTEDMLVAHNTNFIVLITKGSDQLPAQPQEIAHLQAQVRTVARVPILVGDHRLHVDIVTPKLDNTLQPSGWNLLDARIAARLFQMFLIGNQGAGATGDDSVKLVKVIARGMESRRHMIRRSLEQHVFRPLFERNDQLTSQPKLQFHPRAIALDFDAAWASFLYDLRVNNDISRETTLSQFDLDQELEAEYRRRERDEYDEIFMTQVPFAAPNPALPGQPQPQGPAPSTAPAPGPRDNGGGRRKGGGAAPGSGQGQPPRRPTKKSDGGRPVAASGLTSPGGSADEPVTPTGGDENA